jgi:hypothetical protein
MDADQRPKALLGGFAPLVVAAVLALLVVLLVPSVAPEHVVSVPVDEPAATSSTSTTTATTATTAVPAETTATVAP